MPHIAEATVELLVQLVRAQSAEVARLRVEVVALRGEVRASGTKVADDTEAELIEAASAAFPNAAFVSDELRKAAWRDDAAAIRLKPLIAGKSTRAVGKALSAAENKSTREGLVLRRVDDCNAGIVWCVCKV